MLNQHRIYGKKTAGFSCFFATPLALCVKLISGTQGKGVNAFFPSQEWWPNLAVTGPWVSYAGLLGYGCSVWSTETSLQHKVYQPVWNSNNLNTTHSSPLNLTESPLWVKIIIILIIFYLSFYCISSVVHDKNTTGPSIAHTTDAFTFYQPIRADWNQDRTKLSTLRLCQG